MPEEVKNEAEQRREAYEAKSITELQKERREMREKGRSALKQAGAEMDMSKVDVFSKLGDAEANVTALQTLNESLNDLTDAIERKQAAEALRGGFAGDEGGDAPQPEDGAAPELNLKRAADGIGSVLIRNEAFKRAAQSRSWRTPVAVQAGIEALRAVSPQFERAVMLTSDGIPRQAEPLDPMVSLAPTQPVTLTDLLPVIPVSRGAYQYYQETYANAAARRAEGAAAAELDLSTTRVTATAESIAAILPVTEEQLEDAPAAEAYINMRVPFTIRQRLDAKLVAGGASNDVKGLYTQASDAATDVINLTAESKILDVIVDGMAKTYSRAYVDANTVCLSSAKYFDVLKTKDADGRYLFGDPRVAGMDMMVWGLRMVKSDHLAANTGFVAAISPETMALIVAKGLTVETGHDSDDFSKFKLSVRAQVRAQTVFFRPQAVTRLKGLNQAS